jgi:hypothetical protein
METQEAQKPSETQKESGGFPPTVIFALMAVGAVAIGKRYSRTLREGAEKLIDLVKDKIRTDSTSAETGKEGGREQKGEESPQELLEQAKELRGKRPLIKPNRS